MTAILRKSIDVSSIYVNRWFNRLNESENLKGLSLNIKDVLLKPFLPCVYVFYCRKNGCYYVGETNHKYSRIFSHVHSLKKNKHMKGRQTKFVVIFPNLKFQADWNLYGENSFCIFTVMEHGDCNCPQFRKKIETQIVLANPHYCYNKEAEKYLKASVPQYLDYSSFNKAILRLLSSFGIEKCNILMKQYHFVPCIYVFICKKNGWYYVGETGFKFERFSNHIKELQANKHKNFRLQKDWNSCGADEFLMFTIKEDKDCSLLSFRKEIERELVKLNPGFCYNYEARTYLRIKARNKKVQTLIDQRSFNGDSNSKINVLPPSNETVLSTSSSASNNQKIPPSVLQKMQNSGLNYGFIFMGVIEYKTTANSLIEFFCTKHKVYLRRSWKIWNVCFSSANSIRRPVCCAASEDKTALDLKKQDSLHFVSYFNKTPETTPFSLEEQKEIVALLGTSKQKPNSKKGSCVLPPPNERIGFIKEQADRLNADIVSIEKLTSRLNRLGPASKVILFCRNCQKENKGTELRKLSNTQLLRCCTDKLRGTGVSQKIQEKMTSLGHIIVGSPPRSQKDRFVIHCTIHNVSSETSIVKYRYNQFGLSCCGSKKRDRASCLQNLRFYKSM